MRLLNSLKELKLGQYVAWYFKSPIDENDNFWFCISQVNGFHKKTSYPQKINGLVYQTKELITYDIIVKNNRDKYADLILGVRYNFPHHSFRSIFGDHNNKGNQEIETGYEHDKMFQAWLIENEQDYIEVLKNIIVDNL